MPNDIGQGGNRGIVHVRRTQRHRSQRRRLESKAQRGILDLAAAALIGRRGADIVELVIGESPTAVARGAAGLAGEKRESTLG